MIVAACMSVDCGVKDVRTPGSGFMIAHKILVLHMVGD